MYEMKICKQCQKKKFMDASFVYCSWACRNEANTLTKICTYCKNKFTTQVKKQKYCSIRCAQLNQKNAQTIIDGKKMCSKCKAWKKLDHFNKGTCSSGYSSVCKQCKAISWQKYASRV